MASSVGRRITLILVLAILTGGGCVEATSIPATGGADPAVETAPVAASVADFLEADGRFEVWIRVGIVVLAVSFVVRPMYEELRRGDG